MRDPITGRFLSTEDALRQNSIEIFSLSDSDFLSAWNGKDGTWLADRMDEDLRKWHEDDDITEEAQARAQQLSGWYWWTCVSGCLPDSDAFGPFPTERAAASNALEDLD